MSELHDMINSPMVAKASSIIRYSSSHLMVPESLAVHTHEVCMLGLILIDRIRYESPDEEIDSGLYLKKAVLHDIEEVSTGDVPRPLKYSSKEVRDALQKVADIAAVDLFQSTFKNPNMYFEYWEYAKLGKEGVLLKLVDSLVVLRKSIYEVDTLGNKTMLDVVKNAYTLFKDYFEHSDPKVEDNLLKDYVTESAKKYLRGMMYKAALLASECLKRNNYEKKSTLSSIHKGEYD